MPSAATPLSPEWAINAALDARDAGRGEQALPIIEAAVRAWPGDARLWQVLGVVHRALDRSADAAAAFARAARLAPTDRKAAHGVAQATLEAGRPAVQLFERACALAPGDGSLLLGRAAARLAEGDGLRAVAELAAVVDANPMWLEGQATLARLRWSFDRAGFADGYEKALRANPAQPALWTALIDTLIHAECYVEALDVVARAQAATGAGEALLAFKAACRSELGEVEAAGSLFDRLAASGDINLAERHVRHLLRAGRPDHALQRAEPFLQHPASNQIWPYVAIAWRLTGDARYQWLEGDPALIGIYDLDVQDLLGPLAALLRRLHVTRLSPLGQSVRAGTQTDGHLFARDEEEIRRLRGLILDAVHEHVGKLGPADPRHPTRKHFGKRFRFAGSWSVRLTAQGHHTNHIHPLGWLSSACYIVLPEADQPGGAGRGALQFGMPPQDLGIALPPILTVEPKPGRLVLFPSTMWHGTTPFAAGERMSVAFDIAAIS